VVDKDKSIDALIDSGFEFLEGLSRFRDKLKTMSNDPNMRSSFRRNGQPGLGPLTFEARKIILNELLALQDELQNDFEHPLKSKLITDAELSRIKYIWAEDKSNIILRSEELTRVDHTGSL
jgi:DNA sulfur modification protein DndC